MTKPDYRIPKRSRRSREEFPHRNTSDLLTWMLQQEFVTKTAVDAEILLTQIPTATYRTLQKIHDLTRAAGHLNGGEITAAGASTINVAAGQGFIRATADDTSTLFTFDWPAASGLSIPATSTRYVVVEYNFGSPQVALYLSETYDYRTAFPLGVVVNENGVLWINDTPHAIGRAVGRFARRNYEVDGRSRAHALGGLILGETGTRNVAVTAGVTWLRGVRDPFLGLDTSVAGSFDRYYRDNSGGWNREAAQTQTPNDNYDDGSGTLAPLTVNHYGTRWFYLGPAGGIAMLYGRQNNTLLTDAEAEPAPATLPLRLQTGGLLLGRMVYRKNAATAASVSSAFTTTFFGTAASDHGNLSGLLDDDHVQYQLRSEKGAANGYASLDAGATVPDAQIPAAIARDAEVTSAISAHEAAANPHTPYQLRTEKGVANGYASLDAGALILNAEIPGTITGTRTLTGILLLQNLLRIAEQAEPASPPANHANIFAFSDNARTRLRYKDSAGRVVELARDSLQVVRNAQGTTVNAGQVVYVSGGSAAIPSVQLARANSDTTMPARMMIMETILNGSFGLAIRLGHITGVDTSFFSVGALLFLSSTAAGEFTNIAPTHPNLRQPIGVVLTSAVSGVILFDPLGVRGDHDGTNKNVFTLGDGLAGVKDLVFKNVNSLTLRANPTGARVLTLPDATTIIESQNNRGATSGYASLDATTRVPTAQLASGTPTASNFLRGDRTWAVPPGGGGGATATTVEVNLGATPRSSGKFTINDVGIASTSKVLVWQAPGPYTGKGTRADEAAMQPVRIAATEPTDGAATVFWETPPIVVDVPLTRIAAGTATTTFPKDPQAASLFQNQRIGKVKGNVKFHYMVLS